MGPHFRCRGLAAAPGGAPASRRSHAGQLRRTRQGYGRHPRQRWSSPTRETTAVAPDSSERHWKRGGWSVRSIGVTAAIELVGVAKSFGAVEALAPVDLAVERRRDRHRARAERERQDDAAADRRRPRRTDRRAHHRRRRQPPRRPLGQAHRVRPAVAGAAPVAHRRRQRPPAARRQPPQRRDAAARTRRSCSPRSGSPTSPTPTRTSCRAACSSASPSCGRWPSARRCC